MAKLAAAIAVGPGVELPSMHLQGVITRRERMLLLAKLYHDDVCQRYLGLSRLLVGGCPSISVMLTVLSLSQAVVRKPA